MQHVHRTKCIERQVQTLTPSIVYVYVGQAGADGQAGTAGQQGAMLQRRKWTAQVGLVLHSQVPSPLAGYVLPPGEAARLCTV